MEVFRALLWHIMIVRLLVYLNFTAILWQIAIVLLLVYLNFTTAATLVTGMFMGYWFCVTNVALYFQRTGGRNE